MIVRTLLLLAGLAAGAPSQTCVFTGPSDIGFDPPGSNGPGFLSGNYPAGWHQRLQYLVPASMFAGVPHLIRDFAFGVKRGTTTQRFGRIEIRMAHTTVSNLDQVFTNNITLPLQTVLDATDYTITFGVGPRWVPLGLQTPFQFLPAQGNLLIDVTVEGPSEVVHTELYTGMLQGWGIETKVSGASQFPPSQGSNGTRPCLRFCLDKAGWTMLGEACTGSGSAAPLVGVTGMPALGSQTTLWLSNVPPGSPALLAFGGNDGPPFPVDLGFLGAPGCRQYFQLTSSAGLLTDTFGIGTHTITVPPNLALINQITNCQFATLAPGANALGLLTSRYVRLRVGL
ncbi:MAG: hypothetical protein KAI24_05825 [Planctomycetes bacterium]|nr:hypothetical protein [Planctomycetota bacterium]